MRTIVDTQIVTTTSYKQLNNSPQLKVWVDTSISIHLQMLLVGIVEKTIYYIDPVTSLQSQILLTGSVQEIMIDFPSTGDSVSLEFFGDLGFITSLFITDQLHVVDILIKKLSLLDTLILDNCALSESTIDSILIELAKTTTYTNLTIPYNLGLAGQTPSAPPTLKVLEDFCTAWNISSFANVDPQPYMFKIVLPNNTTAGKTIRFTMNLHTQQPVTIDWGQVGVQPEDFGQLSNDCTHIYQTAGTYYIRVIANAHLIASVVRFATYATKFKEFNPKNLINLESFDMSGCGIDKTNIIQALNRIYLSTNSYLNFSFADYFNQSPLVSFTQEEYDYYVNLKPTTYLNINVI